MSKQHEPHPMNVPGDFYVVDQCCAACGVPTHIAPETFAFATERLGGDCYVQRQPITTEEVDRALMVVRCQEFGCVRYGGPTPSSCADSLKRGKATSAMRLCPQGAALSGGTTSPSKHSVSILALGSQRLCLSASVFG
ncbi:MULTISPECIES: ferredoxin [Myxococcus]|uniref:ferredoxin n=1 Tax=Myxococcus TaxID=32 RepID=UPI001E33C6D8|nr:MULTISPECIES: ferredoxin [Myxococcus]